MCPSCITLPVVFSACTVLLQFSLCLSATFFALAFIPASPSCVTAVVTSAEKKREILKISNVCYKGYYCIMGNHLLQLLQRYGTSYWTVLGKGRISISLRNFLVLLFSRNVQRGSFIFYSYFLFFFLARF